MSDVITKAEHEKRVRFKVRIQLVALVGALIGLVAFGIDATAHLNSAVLGGIGLVGLGVAIIAYVWSRVYSMVVLAKYSGPPNLR
ncbi:hypothetical protein ASG04_12575 [Curtobacterium sp. Leaf183]|uniref:hypothetical protein n=1 Tax=Curtobacterium sp. Leaf183 TaxID=1736291 RepID=UPI0006FF5FBF|nr:hypothetical protein [Curtobacterium sp. Leaf183]KQS07980.1 hypothetical protein ASG04_12575 [Curtobacterium sp. Leaf183]